MGLIVTEGTQPSDDGQGYLATPGIYTPAHVAGWKKVTTAVHDKGGRIFIQIMHAGRMSHPDNTPHHRQAVAPSAIAPGAQMFTATGMKDIPAPRALTTEEVRRTVADFRHAARAAIDAGADGVELHGANSYLIQQCFAPSANARSDEYGGSIANRTRFAIEVVSAVAGEIGADRTAIRLSPSLTMNGIDEGTEGPALYRHLVAALDELGQISSCAPRQPDPPYRHRRLLEQEAARAHASSVAERAQVRADRDAEEYCDRLHHGVLCSGKLQQSDHI